MIAGGRNVTDENTLNFLNNFIEDFQELLSLYGIIKVHGWDDGSIVLTMENGIEHDIEIEVH